MIMTPLLPISIHGDDCGMLQAGEVFLGSGTEYEYQKCLTSAEIARAALQDASSPPEEWPDWNVPTSSFNPDEGLTSSALRGRLLQLELGPGMQQGTPSETSSSRNSISFRLHGEGAHGSRAPQSSYAGASVEHDRHHSFEDSMDISDADALPPVDEYAAAHQRLASTIPMWEVERPCRPNPNSNHDMALFLASWRVEYEMGRVMSPISENVQDVRQPFRPTIVTKRHVADGFDMQGTDWAAFGTDAAEVKGIRRRYHQHPHIRQFPDPVHATRLRETGHTFRFQHTNTTARPWIEHYQLRNLVATTSFNDIHYVSRSKVMSTGPTAHEPLCVMDLDNSSHANAQISDFHITSLVAAGTTLIAGGFRGQYAVQDLLSNVGTLPTVGYVSHHPHAITNHIHSTNNRASGRPMAVFCSNDRYVRTLDIETNHIISSIMYEDVMNCAATSPNGRLRVLAGDFEGALISDADSGRVLENVRGPSRGHGFACAWADDDITVATAGQDCQVLVWDARNWSVPLAAIATEHTYATSLRFSPLGGGSPLLIIAEAADTVSVVDATTYATKQNIEFFGDVAGTALSADGTQLTVANGDRHLGGLMTFARREFDGHDGAHAFYGGQRERLPSHQRSDWLPECELEFHPRVRIDAKSRRRRGLRFDDMLF